MSDKLFEIKHRYSGDVLFSLECGSLRGCVEAAVSSDANLADANLAGANLAGANLAGANLAGANLTDANLASANLSDANSAAAYLAAAYLAGANLTDANLAGAYLAYANLADANLAYANLTGASLAGAKGINPRRATPLLMLYDQPGPIRLYKLVNSKNEGTYKGGLKYEIGQTVSVDDAATNVTQQCAAGINVATLDWCMREWREDYRILIVEFEVKDIAAIPTATDGKIRLHRCKVVDEKDLTELGLVEQEAT